MARIQPVKKNDADAATAALLDSVERSMGGVPNVISTMANSPAVAKAYIGVSQILSTGKLPARLREQIALTVAEVNECGYCVAAHTALGQGVGLTERETCEARQIASEDPKEQAALEFVEKLVNHRARVSDSELEHIRQAGYSDGEIAEIVANVALNIFTNYINHVAETDIDFPAAPVLSML